MLVKLSGRLTIIEEIPYTNRGADEDYEGPMDVTVRLHSDEVDLGSRGNELPRAIVDHLSERNFVRFRLSSDKTLLDYGEVSLELVFEDDE